MRHLLAVTFSSMCGSNTSVEILTSKKADGCFYSLGPSVQILTEGGGRLWFSSLVAKCANGPVRACRSLRCSCCKIFASGALNSRPVCSGGTAYTLVLD